MVFEIDKVVESYIWLLLEAYNKYIGALAFLRKTTWSHLYSAKFMEW